MSDTVQDAPTVAAPPLTREDYDTLLEALEELTNAFGGPQRSPLPEIANAREWLRRVWEAQNSPAG